GGLGVGGEVARGSVALESNAEVEVAFTCFVGRDGGRGEMRVIDSTALIGTMGHSLLIGAGPGSRGEVTIVGAGSALDIRKDLVVGDHGDGNLLVEQGAEVVADVIEIGKGRGV